MGELATDETGRARRAGSAGGLAEAPRSVAGALVRIGSLALPWLLLVALWSLVRWSGLVKPALVPAPTEVAARFWTMLTRERFVVDIAMSSERVLLGVALGIL